ncbi:DUF1349 domain-containing protein [Paenibacillus sp. N3.4]|uniref:beta-xylosidase family glycoside hydrolase n=1 Tax=Paenibacillus sp. N3.4 TaxID=2603222 RepID=UPI0037C6085A
MAVDYVRVYRYNGQYADPGPRPGKNLGSGWSWVREEGSAWSVEGNPKAMKITTQEGGFTRPTKPNNILLRNPAPSETGDFTVSTKIKFNATVNFEYAGLIMYQDDNNYVSLGRCFSANNQIRFTEGRNGGATDKNYADPITPQDIYLKIEKKGSKYNGYYSIDGKTWILLTDSFNISLNNPKIGIFTRKLGPASKTAEFTEFKWNDIQISF